MLASAPRRVKTCFATSRMRSRLRWASERGLRAGFGVAYFFMELSETGLPLRLSYQITETHSVYFRAEARVKEFDRRVRYGDKVWSEVNDGRCPCRHRAEGETDSGDGRFGRSRPRNGACAGGAWRECCGGSARSGER